MRPAAEAPTSTVVDCSGVGPGGITRVLTEIVRFWPGGHRLELVAVPAGWDVPDGVEADVRTASRQAGGRGRSIAAATTALRRATADLDPATTRLLSLSPSIAVAGSRLPVVTVMHDLAFKLWPHDLPAAVRQYRKTSYGMAVSRSERLLCVSARTQHDLLGVYGVPVERTRVWHPGSDVAGSPGELPAALRGRPYLVVPGHAAHKGVELAVEALAEHPRYTLAVLTGGQRVEAFERAAAASPAAARVVFLDRLSDADYLATLAGAAAFLMPSHFEGYGLPAAEAMRLGTPTVISPDPALHEATGGDAIRMATWTGAALAAALRALDTWKAPPAAAHRGWRQAAEELAGHVGVRFATARPQPVPEAVPEPGEG
ncbi:glycosyltransferase [Dactylosporangium sp. NPDC049525]|uniref:glycosyltransferase n=1 Tax=Dactylosporangium sp. NPDC049525 TaxID=3154730 RepID=UPI003425B367